MKKTICKVEYDTEASTVVKKFTSGELGDSFGYEETLYVTNDGKYFVYANGGADSPYPTEQLTRIGKGKVDEWIAQH